MILLLPTFPTRDTKMEWVADSTCFSIISPCTQSLLSSLVSQKRTDMPILIVGNKMDLPEATGVDEYAVRQALDVDQVSRTPSSS
jgi:GTPase SAR1 family protein